MKLNNAILKKYLGVYEIRPGMLVELTLESGHLEATTDHKEELYAQRENRFIAESGDNQMEIEFGMDETTKIDNLVLYAKGQKMDCKKVN